MFDPTLKRAMLDGVVADMQGRSKSVEYRDDPVRWAQDFLGITLWSKQKEVLQSLVENKKTAVKSCHAAGKGLPLSTPIPTPHGFKTMGELSVGDVLFGPLGEETTVTYVSEDKLLDNYEVVFDDGSVVKCDADHLWQVQDLNKRPRYIKDWRDHWDATETVAVTDLLTTLRTNAGQYRWRIPAALPIQHPHNPSLPIDPYLLGVWLGDGDAHYGAITGGPSKTFYGGLFPDGKVKADPRNAAVRYRSAWFTSLLRVNNLLKNKHIPHDYIWNASEEQRWALLSGLLDSDGYFGNSVEIDLTSKVLSDDLLLLLHSLGLKAAQRTATAGYRLLGDWHDTGFRFRITFSSTRNPFRNRDVGWVAPKTSKSTIRTIVDIRPAAKEVTRCITVDNDLSCFLATENFIPTHNTFLSGVAVCWWISTRPNSMVRSTAPTSYQVHELLWEEIRKMHAQHNLVGWVNLKDEWKRDLYGASVLVGSGKKPSDTNIHAFQGVHRPDGVLTILDEGGGVPATLYTAADAISTGDWDRVLSVGNPDDPDTEFGRIFMAKNPVWNLMTISAFDTPNFTNEPVPEIVGRGLIQPDWVEQRKSEWGEDSSRYKAKILAEFPDQSDDAFFKQAVIDKAYDTEISGELLVPGILGVDVASSGNDHSVVALNRGGKIRIIDRWNHSDIVESIDKIFDLAKRNGVREIRLDSVGYGEAVSQQMQHDPRLADYIFIPVKGSYAARDSAAHKNARAEQFDNLRLQMSQGKIDLDRTDQKLSDQLLAIKGLLTAKGQIQIESKEDMRARGVKSPDELDAVVYAAADFDYLFNKPLPTGTKIYEDLDTILGENNSVLGLMGSF